MERILANREADTQQLFFNSYKECADFFKRPQNAIKYSVNTGEPVKTFRGEWCFDVLEEMNEE